MKYIEVLKMNSFKELYESLDVDTVVSIKIKKEQIDYCFAAETFDEFMIRYRKLIDWAVATINDELIKKRINEIPKQLKKSAQYTFYVDTDTVQKKYRGGFIK